MTKSFEASFGVAASKNKNRPDAIASGRFLFLHCPLEALCLRGTGEAFGPCTTQQGIVGVRQQHPRPFYRWLPVA